MAPDDYQWVASSGGSWTSASSWLDLTTGAPATSPPGAADTVTIVGPTGSRLQILAGNGAAAAATFIGNTNISGTLQVGSLTVGSNGTASSLNAFGGVMIASSGTVAAGVLSAAGAGAAVKIAGTLAIGAGPASVTEPAVQVIAANGGTIQLGGLSGTGGSLTVLSASSSGVVEIGTAGHAAGGAVTIDAGATLSGALTVNLGATTVDNGSLIAAGGTLALGSLGGTGALAIDSNATLSLGGAIAPGLGVSFAGSDATLTLGAEQDAPSGVLTGFAAGDAIDFVATEISAAAYNQTGANAGRLTLSYGGTVATVLTLAGNYAGDVFLVNSDGANGTEVTVAATGSSGGTAISDGTTAPDAYVWTQPGQSGAWTSAADWTDSTTGSAALLGPGAHDAVTITGASGTTFQVVNGYADVASLALLGNTAFTGHVTAGTLAIGTAATGSAGASAGALDLTAGAQLIAGPATIADGGLSLTGTATAVTLTSLALGSGIGGVGLPFNVVTVTAGADLRLGALVMGGGTADIISTDSTDGTGAGGAGVAGSVEIGSATPVTAGAVSVGTTATVLGNGSLDAYGQIINAGTITASGGVLSLGSVSGGGALVIGANAGLALLASDTDAVTFSSSGSATLALQSPSLIGATLYGYAPSDAIDIIGSPITAATWQATAGGLGLLTLSYQGTTSATLTLSGSYASDVFSTTSDGAGGTDIVVASAVASGGGSTGAAGATDTYQWHGSGNGSWTNAASWLDETTGATAASAPGSLSSVMIAGPTGSSVMQLAGPGTARQLTLTGNANFVGSFAASTLVDGLAGTAASIALTTGATLSTGTLTIANGAINTDGAGTSLTVAGLATLGGQAVGLGAPTGVLYAADGAAIRIGTLALGGGIGTELYADQRSSIEVGGGTSGAAGVLTIDAGATVSGFGTINLAGIADAGTLLASGGDLVLAGPSRGGVLQVAAGATLSLTGIGASSSAISLTGAQATLELGGTKLLPTGTISGFAPGDEIIVDGSSSIDGVSYSATAGTLALSYGGTLVGTLGIAGAFAGDSFSVAVASNGAVITLATSSTPGTSSGGTSSGGTSTGGTSTGGTSTGGTSTGGTSSGGTSSGGTSSGGTSTGGTSTGGTSTGGTSTGGTSTGGTSTGGTSTGGTSTGGTSTGGTSTGGTSTGGTSTGGTSTGGTSTGGTSTGGTSTGGTSTGGTSSGGTSSSGTSVSVGAPGGNGGVSVPGGSGSSGGTSTGGTGSSGTGTGTGSSGATASMLLAEYLAAEPTYRASQIESAIKTLTALGQPTYILSSVTDTPSATAVNLAILDLDNTSSSYTLQAGLKGALMQGVGAVNVTDGGAGGSLLTANNGNGSLVGLGADDTLVGGGGSTFIYSLQPVTMVGGSGHDTFVTGNGNALVLTGQDTVGSTVYLGAGHNTLVDNGPDIVVETEGTDTVYASTAVTVFGGTTGELFFYSGNKASTVVMGRSTALVYGSTANGGIVYGGSNSVQVVNGAGAATFVGGSGEMLVYMGSGGGALFGGTGSGQYYGGNGPTTMTVGQGPTTVAGGDQNGIFIIGGYADQIAAGGGNETLFGATATGNDTYFLGTGTDLVYGGSGNDLFSASSGTAVISGGSGSNLYQFVDGAAGGHLTLLDFTPGRDHLVLYGYSKPASSVLATQLNAGGNTQITLQDGTTVLFGGVRSLDGSSFL